jgi:hypothetical protein
MVLPSPPSDGTVEAMLVVMQGRCRVMLATMLPSHAGDNAAEVTWPRCDVDAKL